MKLHQSSRRANPKRVALFGGTFNPIHIGHLQVARDVVQQLDLDCVYFIPSALPPHKSIGKLASAKDRLAMVRLAIGDQARFMTCDAEIKRSGPSYSIDTVRQFKQSALQGSQLFFVLGMDAFLEIHTWKAFDQLFAETDFIVMSRPGSGQWSLPKRREIENYVKGHIASAYALSDTGDLLMHPKWHTIHLVPVTPVNIASSQIRAMIQNDAPVDTWVPPPVAQYIYQKGLYQ